MNKFLQYILGACAVVFVVVFAISSLSGRHQTLGATTVGYQTSQGNVLLFNGLSSLISDVTNVRAPLAGLISATKSYNPGTINNPTTTIPSVDVTTAGAVAGDLVLVSSNPAPSSSVVVVGSVTGSGTTTISFLQVGSSTSAVMSTTTYTVRVLPAASFAAPASILTATSSSTF